MVAIKNWMSNIDDNTLLKDVVMPGSHDAGVWASPTGSNVKVTNSLMPVSSIAAQLGDIKDQAEAGSRWFDIRMYKTPTRWAPWEKSLRPSALGGHKMKLRAAHVPAFQEGAIAKGLLQSPGLGGYGASIEQILTQAISFVTNPATRSEFVVIRFSHCPEPKKVLKEIKYYLADDNQLFRGNILTRSKPNLTTKLGNTPMSVLRSRVALIFDEKFHKYAADDDYRSWMFLYSKNIGSASHVCCCGSYADSPDTAIVKNATLSAATAHLTHADDGHLCFAYWQLTQRSISKQMTGGGNIAVNTKAAGGTHAATGGLMDQLLALPNPQNRMPANVISHDFVNEETSQKIVKANGGKDFDTIKVPWPGNW